MVIDPRDFGVTWNAAMNTGAGVPRRARADLARRPRRSPGRIAPNHASDHTERVSELFADVFAGHGWSVTRHSDGWRAGEAIGGRVHYDVVLVEQIDSRAHGKQVRRA